LKDGRKAMCAVAWNSEVGLFRFYPLNVLSPAKVWLECDMDLEPDEGSYRKEDWKLVESKKWDTQEDRIRPVKLWKRPEPKIELLEKLVELSHPSNVDPVDYCNEERRSIVMVRPKQLEGRLKTNPSFRNGSQGHLWDDYEHWVMCQNDYRHIAQLRWVSQTGKEHDAKIVAQEFHMGLRNRPDKIWSFSQIYNHEYTKYLLLGNIKAFPNAFVVVHVHRIKTVNLSD